MIVAFTMVQYPIVCLSISNERWAGVCITMRESYLGYHHFLILEQRARCISKADSQTYQVFKLERLHIPNTWAPNGIPRRDVFTKSFSDLPVFPCLLGRLGLMLPRHQVCKPSTHVSPIPCFRPWAAASSPPETDRVSSHGRPQTCLRALIGRCQTCET